MLTLVVFCLIVLNKKRPSKLIAPGRVISPANNTLRAHINRFGGCYVRKVLTRYTDEAQAEPNLLVLLVWDGNY